MYAALGDFVRTDMARQVSPEEHDARQVVRNHPGRRKFDKGSCPRCRREARSTRGKEDKGRACRVFQEYWQRQVNYKD